MEIAAGMDVHDKFCVIHVTNGKAGRIKKSDQAFLDEVNILFGKVRTNSVELGKFVKHLEGHNVHYLIENSTIANKVFRIMADLGCDIYVAQSFDLTIIRESVTKNDENDAEELAHYMRRRLLGENEFAVCMMAPPEWMAKKELVRAVYKDKLHLSNTKKRVRARIKVMGADLRDYEDISCNASLIQLRATNDPFLCYEVQCMKDALKRIKEGEKVISYLFQDDEDYKLIMSIPGIGSPLAAYLKTIILDINRFDRLSQLESYFGLVPKQDSSADRDPNRCTTHRGDELAREYLGYAVQAHVMHSPDSIVAKMYHRLKSKGKPHKKVVTACSRELLGIVRSVLKNRRPYTTDRDLLQIARGCASCIESEVTE